MIRNGLVQQLARIDPAFPRQIGLMLVSCSVTARIVRQLDAALHAIEQAVAVTDRGVSKLLEYRSPLISAMVTGQIDIRQHGREAT